MIKEITKFSIVVLCLSVTDAFAQEQNVSEADSGVVPPGQAVGQAAAEGITGFVPIAAPALGAVAAAAGVAAAGGGGAASTTTTTSTTSTN